MSHQDLIGAFYAARARRDWPAARALLADDIAWHEPGTEDYSGTHRGAETVIALLKRLVDITEGTFALRPEGFITTAEHVATNALWTASRGDVHVEGQELAIFHIENGKITEAWFHPDGYDPEALATVFSFDETQSQER